MVEMAFLLLLLQACTHTLLLEQLNYQLQPTCKTQSHLRLIILIMHFLMSCDYIYTLYMLLLTYVPGFLLQHRLLQHPLFQMAYRYRRIGQQVKFTSSFFRTIILQTAILCFSYMYLTKALPFGVPATSLSISSWRPGGAVVFLSKSVVLRTILSFTFTFSCLLGSSV